MSLDKTILWSYFFPQHYDKFMFTDIKFTSGFNQNLNSK